MATLPTATNSAPGTSYFGGGGGGGGSGDITATSLTISTCGTFAPGQNFFLNYRPVPGQTGIRIVGLNDPNYQGLQLFADGIGFQQAGTGTSATFVGIDTTQSAPNWPGVQLTNISSINAKAPAIADSVNRGPVLIQFGTSDPVSSGSTIITFNTAYGSSNYTIALTQASGQPTVTPWVREKVGARATCAGDEGAVFDWVAVGV